MSIHKHPTSEVESNILEVISKEKIIESGRNHQETAATITELDTALIAGKVTADEEYISNLSTEEIERITRGEGEENVITETLQSGAKLYITTDDTKFHNDKFGCKPCNYYHYTDKLGNTAFYVVRWDFINNGEQDKATLPYIYDSVKNRYSSKWPTSSRPLYNLLELYQHPTVAVMIVEGEKTADAAKLLFPDHVVVTSSGGSKAASKTDWSILKDRNIIISPDCDEAGKSYSSKVETLCKEVGANSIKQLCTEKLGQFIVDNGVIVERQGAVQKGYDLADAATDGWTADLIKQISTDSRFSQLFIIREDSTGTNRCDSKNSSVSKTTNAPQQNQSTYNFILTKEKGVQYETEDKDGNIVLKWLCSYLEVTHYTRDETSNSWGRVLKIIDLDKVEKEFVMPMSMLAGDAISLREKLLDLGVTINSGNIGTILKFYISTFKTSTRAICATKVGWHNGQYILPSKVYGKPTEERYIFQSATEAKPFICKGILKEWQENIAKFAIGNPLLAFSISAAFTAPFLSLLGEENVGFHFSGSSSIGKTTALRVASSVWGSAVNSWRTTDNAAESLCKQANDGILLFDELSEVDGNSADAMAYMLGNGVGKARANRNADARPISKFTLIFLSSGETGLQAKLYEKGKNPKAGQTVRFIEIPADAGSDYGIFENLHEFTNSRDLSNHLREMSSKFYGTPIDVFLPWLINDLEENIKIVSELKDQWIKEYSPKDADNQAQRVAGRFAVVAAVGELVIQAGILPLLSKAIFESCNTLFQRWIKERGGLESHEITQCKHRLIMFIQEHGSSRFENAWSTNKFSDTQTPIEQKVIKRAGFKQLKEDIWEYYFLPEVFEAEIIQGLDKKVIIPNLITQGYIAPDKQNKSTKNIYVPGYSSPKKQTRLYHVSGNKISGEDD